MPARFYCARNRNQRWSCHCVGFANPMHIIGPDEALLSSMRNLQAKADTARRFLDRPFGWRLA